MKEKRAFRLDGSPEGKTAHEAKRMKHSKHADVSSVSSPKSSSKKSPSKHAKTPDSTPKTKSKSRTAPGLEERSLVPSTAEDSIHDLSKDGDSWSLSCRTGGRFLDLDPVCSSDEKYLILAKDDLIQVFSMATSSLVRILQRPGTDHIVGYRLSPADPNHLFVATHSGSLIEWDWTTDEWIHSWGLARQIVAIDATAVTRNGFETLAIYTICKADSNTFEICMSVKVETDTETQDWEQSVLYKTSTRLTAIRVAAGSHCILAVGGSFVVVGERSRTPKNSDDNNTIWREVSLPSPITSFDLRVSLTQSQKPSKRDRGPPESVVLDLVVGDSEGAILIYHDLINIISRTEKEGELGSGLVSRRLHWHRDRVMTVKWSKDGNYIISGGLETVLVLWQLDTGRKQFLPHLTSPICNLTVSPSGTSYLIKLADNSFMVLSTSELRPTTSVSGLQLPPSDEITAVEPKLKKRKKQHRRSHDKLPAIAHPLLPEYLLIAVPSSLSILSPHRSRSASFLQTFDMRSNQHVSRQALARTNVSILSTGPEGTELSTPDIKFIQISPDGDWLATVDEWEPYAESIRVLSPINELSEKNKEICLKFWHRNQDTDEWELVSRIDGPHTSPCGGSMPLRDIAVSPTGLRFASIGDDGVVRLWAPEYKPRSSKDSSQPRQVKTWRCSKTIALELSNTPNKPVGSCLAFSEDGSALAVCWRGQSDPNSGLVYIIDPYSGEICQTRGGLFSGIPHGCGFLDRYLIVLSDHLVSWQMVMDQTMFTLSFAQKLSASHTVHFAPLLAFNHKSQTFAVAFADGKLPNSKIPNYRVALFEPTTPNPLFEHELSSAPRALLANVKSEDYTIIDSRARIISISRGGQAAVPLDEETIDLPPNGGLQDIFGTRRLMPQQDQPDAEGETALIRHGNAKSLADIFDIGPSFTLPGVEVLLTDVVDMFSSSKPVKV